jgi:hypothetical protein
LIFKLATFIDEHFGALRLFAFGDVCQMMDKQKLARYRCGSVVVDIVVIKELQLLVVLCPEKFLTTIQSHELEDLLIEFFCSFFTLFHFFKTNYLLCSLFLLFILTQTTIL